MAKILDLRNSGGELVIIGRMVALPTSSDSDSPLPFPGSLRYNPVTNRVEVFKPAVTGDMTTNAWGDIAVVDGSAYMLATGSTMSGNLTFSGSSRVLNTGGTENAPSYAFSAAPTTGIFRDGSSLAISIAGNKQLTISASDATFDGDLGVGGTISGSSDLTVSGNISGVDVTASGEVSAASSDVSGNANVTGTLTATTASIGTLTISGTRLKLPSGNTAQRPTSPVAGNFRYNEEIGAPEYFNGGVWRKLTGPIPGSVPTITGSRGGNAALTNLINALVAMNLIFDGTTA